MILGHEIVGRIEALGEGVTCDSGNRPLKRRGPDYLDDHGQLREVLLIAGEKGLMMKCRELTKYGHDSCDAAPHFNGGFAEYCYITSGHLRDPENCSMGEDGTGRYWSTLMKTRMVMKPRGEFPGLRSLRPGCDLRSTLYGIIAQF